MATYTMIVSILVACDSSALYISSQPIDQKIRDDKIFVMKIRQAIAKKIPMDKIEDYVAKKATINTMRPEDKKLWPRINLEIDAKESEIKKLGYTTKAAYWVRNIDPNEWGEPKVVGLVWTKKNEMKLFFGAVLPP